MRIHCDDLAVFGEVEHRGLQRMLMRVREGQHSLVLGDLHGFYASRFFARAVATGDRQEVRELLERQTPELADRALDPGLRPPGPRAELISIALPEHTCEQKDGAPIWYIDPSTVGEWSEKPLRVLLENDRDWILVETATRVYARPAIRKSFSRGFIVRDQRGGVAEVKKSVAACTVDERIFVLIDSDRTEVGGAPGRTQQEILELAKTRPHIRVFILQKREVENYIPHTVWEASTGQAWRASAQQREKLIERRKKLAEWQQLADEAKDVIDLETYFPDAKEHITQLANPVLVPDARTMESRDRTRELFGLLNELEAWL